jgi:dihydroorotate dehydrogenase
MYQLLRNILFWFDAEKVHYFSMNFLAFICRISFIKKILKRQFAPSVNPVQCIGLTFSNGIGLAAGFDKNARYLNELETLGFGFVEIGTVTPKPQHGNPKPRLFRLPKDKALINRMGFNNDGVQAVAIRLRKYKKQRNGNLVIGGNIGKNKITPNDLAWQDYEICFNELHDTVDYFVVNVSSPNTPGLRDLQQKDALGKILRHLQEINKSKSIQRPLLLKISPDLALEELDDIIDLAVEIKLDGLVAANTTINRENLQTTTKDLENIGAGGLSGKPLRAESNKLTAYIHQRAPHLPVISSGGIFTRADAEERWQSGAALLQVWSGFIYEGPAIMKNLVAQKK